MPTGQATPEFIQMGLELKALRVRAGLTQPELVEKSDGQLRMGTVIAIEKGKYNVGFAQVITYANILGYKLVPQPLNTDRQ